MNARTLWIVVGIALALIAGLIGLVLRSGDDDGDPGVVPMDGPEIVSRPREETPGERGSPPPESLLEVLVTGEVISRREGPLAGAVVLTRDAAGASRSLLTDENGEFEVPGLGEGLVELVASAPGHAAKRYGRLRKGSRVRITLEAGVPFRATVLTAEGVPLSDATLRLHPVARPELGPLRLTTGKDGGVSVKTLAPGRYDALVTHDEGAPWLDVGMVVPYPDGLEKEFRLLPPKILDVRVMTTERELVPGAEVTVTWPIEDARPLPFERTRGPFVTDADGQCEVPNLSAGKVRLRVRAAGHGGIEIVHDLNLASEVTLYVLPSVTVKGRVVAPDGGVVPDALVAIIPSANLPRRAFAETAAFLFRASPWEDEAGIRWPSVTADLKGRFTIHGLPKGASGFLEAHDPRGQWAQSARTPLDMSRAGTVEVTLTMKEGARVAGRVRNPAGDGVARARVGYGETWVLTADDGSFRLPPLPLGERLLAVIHELHAVEKVPVDVGSPEATALTVVLDPRQRLRGRVGDRAGQPIPSALVQVSKQDGPLLRSTVTDHEGRFAVGGFDATRVTVVVHAQGFASERREDVATGDAELVIPLEERPLEAQGDVAGAVVDADAGTPVVIETIAGAPPGQVQIVTGGFLVQNLAPGRYAFRILAPGFQPHTLDRIDVAGGERLELPLIRLHRAHPLRVYVKTPIRVKDPRSVRLVVTELEGQGNPRGLLLPRPADLPARVRLRLGGAGAAFDLPTLRSGRYRLSAEAPGARPGSVELTVPAPADTALLPLAPR